MLTTILVKDYMSSRLVTLTPETDVFEAIRKLLENRITGAPVIDEEGNLVGMFSEKGCMKVVLEASYNQGMGGKVSEFMTHTSETIDGEASIVDAAEKFLNSDMRNIPVFEDVDLVGIISRTDVLRALSSHQLFI